MRPFAQATRAVVNWTLYLTLWAWAPLVVLYAYFFAEPKLRMESDEKWGRRWLF